MILKKLFMLFMFYSFVGWFIEVWWTFFNDKKLVNRGFLIGPYCPIYGWGCLILIVLLDRFRNNIGLLFVMSIIICSILEYFTSYIMEKLFKARWWDYSNYKLNLNGRICVRTMLPFGVLSVLVVYFVNPIIFNRIIVSDWLFYILLFIFVIDNFVSFSIISNLRGTIASINFDCTEEISKRVKEILIKKSIFHKRLIKAFPSFISPVERLKKIVKR